MKTTIQNLIFLVVLGVAGYFAYQYFFGSSQEGSTPATTFNIHSLPEECQKEGENLKNAFYQYKIGERKKVEVNMSTGNFRRCLKNKAGFSDSQIDEAVKGVEDSS